MARNDIKFAQANQADFGQANQMYLASMQQANDAIKGLQDTAKTFGDVVTKKNTATVKDMINQLSFDDWNNPEKQKELQQNIDAFNQKVGNATYHDEVVKHKQDNYQRLLDDHNKYLVNQEARLAMENKSKANEVDTLLAQYVHSNDEQRKALLDNTQDAKLKYDLLQAYDKHQVDKLKTQTSINTETENLINSQLLQHHATISNYAREFQENTTLAQMYPSDSKEHQQYLAKAGQAEQSLINYTANTGIPADRVMALFNTGIDSNATRLYGHYGTPRQQQQDKASATKAERQYNLEVAKTQVQVAQQERQLDIQQQNADTRQVEVQAGIEKSAVDTALKMQEQQNKTTGNNSGKLTAEQQRTQAVLGNSINPNTNQIIPNNLKNHTYQTINRIIETTSPLTPVSDADYQKFLVDKFGKYDAGWLEGSKATFLKELDNTVFNGKPLSNAEKMYVLSQAMVQKLSWWDGNKQKQITNNLKQLQSHKNLLIDEKLTSYANNIIQELVNQNLGQQEIVTLLKQTYPPAKIKYLPETYRKALQGNVSKPKTIPNYKNPNTGKYQLAPTNNTTRTKDGTPTGEYILSNWQ